MKSGLIEIAVTLHHETPKAWLVSDDGKRWHAKWVPKSQGEIALRGAVAILTIPERLAAEKGFA